MFTSPNSPRQDHDTLFSFFNFPSPNFSLYQDQLDSSIFLQPLMENYTTTIAAAPAASVSVLEPNLQLCVGKFHDGKTIKRKRSSKKDRHSKITTAKGPRDRRMRLSLEVARKFFDLQDMLGFDKASQTVEWLLTQSNSSVEKLSKSLGIVKNETTINCNNLGARSSSPSTSECDVGSGIFDDSSNRNAGQGQKDDFYKDLARKERKPNARGVASRANVPPSIVRESRKQARARAKERTVEKMRIQSLERNGSKPSSNQEIGQEIVEESQLGQNLIISYMKPSMEHVVIGDSSTITGGDHYLPQNGISQEHLLRDFQLLSKPWEAFSGSIYLC